MIEIFNENNVKITLADPAYISQNAGILLPRIKKVAEKEKYGFLKIVQRIRGGKYPLILCEKDGKLELVLVCSIISIDNRNLLTLFMIEGENLVFWAKRTVHVEKYAKREWNCVESELWGRKAHLKLFPDYHQHKIVMRKTL